jgi:hypothetical protein
MKKYAYIKNGRVNQFLFAFSGDFPNVPLNEMFRKEITDNCIEIDEFNTTIHEGMDYNFGTGEFTEHVDPEPKPPIEQEILEEIPSESESIPNGSETPESIPVEGQ